MSGNNNQQGDKPCSSPTLRSLQNKLLSKTAGRQNSQEVKDSLKRKLSQAQSDGLSEKTDARSRGDELNGKSLTTFPADTELDQSKKVGMPSSPPPFVLLKRVPLVTIDSSSEEEEVGLAKSKNDGCKPAKRTCLFTSPRSTPEPIAGVQDCGEVTLKSSLMRKVFGPEIESGSADEDHVQKIETGIQSSPPPFVILRRVPFVTIDPGCDDARVGLGLEENDGQKAKGTWFSASPTPGDTPISLHQAPSASSEPTPETRGRPTIATLCPAESPLSPSTTKATLRHASPRKSPRLVKKRLRDKILENASRSKQEKAKVNDLEAIDSLFQLCTRKGEVRRTVSVAVEEDGNKPSPCVLFAAQKSEIFADTGVPFHPISLIVWPSLKYKLVFQHFEVIEEAFVEVPGVNEADDRSGPSQSHCAPARRMDDLINQVLDGKSCPGIKPSLVKTLGFIPKSVLGYKWPSERYVSTTCKKILIGQAQVCNDCKQSKKHVNRLIKKKLKLTAGERLARQLPTSRVKLSALSPESRQARQKNVQQSRRNLIKAVNKYRKKCSVKLTDSQTEELEQLMESIGTSETGKMELEKVFQDADDYKTGHGQKLQMLWNEDRKSFFKDQAKNVSGSKGNRFSQATIRLVSGSKGNRFSQATIRLALAIYSRSPAAYTSVKDLKILHLPCSRVLDKVLKTEIDSPGIQPGSILKQRHNYESFKTRIVQQKKPEPCGTGALLYDETKVQSRLEFNCKDGGITGLAMTPHEWPLLHDVFESLDPETTAARCSYVLQTMWRDLTSPYDIIGPYFTTESSIEHKFLYDCIMKSMNVFNTFGFKIIALVCDGASTNLALVKMLCGLPNKALAPSDENEDPLYVKAEFRNPFEASEDNRVFVIICPSHQLKNMIAALYSSRDSGTKAFEKDSISFGWKPIKDQYYRDQERANQNLARRVPGLKFSFIVRDNWTRLNVLPAKIMQQRYMISALKEYATIGHHSPQDAEVVLKTVEYLDACHKIFEKGILSHAVIRTEDSKALSSIKDGFKFFREWSELHEQTDYPDNSKKGRNKKFLSWQTMDLLRFMVNGFLQLCSYFLSIKPGYFISPLRLNISALESFFSTIKYQARGNLSGTNYAICRGRVMWRKDLRRTSSGDSSSGYRDQPLHLVQTSDDIDGGNFTPNSQSVVPSRSVRILAYHKPFRIDDVIEFQFPSELSQSTIGDRQGSNACTIIDVIAGYNFIKSNLISLRTKNELPDPWFNCLTDAMAEGNTIHDFVFAGAAADLDVEDVANMVGKDVHIQHYDLPIFISLVNGDAQLITELEKKRDEKAAGVTTMCGKSVAVLIQEMGDLVIFDSHQHPPKGASLALGNQAAKITEWLITCFRVCYSARPQSCELTWIHFDTST